MRGLDHRHVIGAVANRQRHFQRQRLLDHCHNLRLLLRRHTRTDHGLDARRKLEEKLAHFRIFAGLHGLLDSAQRVCVYHQARLLWRKKWDLVPPPSLIDPLLLLLESVVRVNERIEVGLEHVRHRDTVLIYVRQADRVRNAAFLHAFLGVLTRDTPQHVHLEVNELAAVADVDRRAHLVASEHPHLDTAVSQSRNGVAHTALKLVLNGGSPHQFKSKLDLIHDRVALLLSVHERDLRRVHLRRPRFILCVRDLALAHEQGAEAVVHVLVEVCHRGLVYVWWVHVRVGGEALLNDVIRTLGEDHDRAVRVAHDH
mmetsp:Transcript_20400/g.47414  ORF Transcript_20400/g.47414 Transcript_20400/m.47414 type:complete len:314 (-) Transcript_20400:1957-2898(-)